MSERGGQVRLTDSDRPEDAGAAGVVDEPQRAQLVPELAVMDRGKVLAQGAPQAVLDDPLVREAYLGGVS